LALFKKAGMKVFLSGWMISYVDRLDTELQHSSLMRIFNFLSFFSF